MIVLILLQYLPSKHKGTVVLLPKGHMGRLKVLCEPNSQSEHCRENKMSAHSQNETPVPSSDITHKNYGKN
jgi:hypothetical protein